MVEPAWIVGGIVTTVAVVAVAWVVLTWAVLAYFTPAKLWAMT